MIRVIFKITADHKVASFEMTGHADSGEYGHDIVCAAVSALTFSTVNGLERVAKTHPTITKDEKNGGYLKATELDKGHDSQIILNTFLNGLLDIQEGYNNYIQVSMKSN